MPVVLGSISCVWLMFRFQPFVGRRQRCDWAALAMAVSPGFVFYGRYTIHEVWLLLFSMLFILGISGSGVLGTRGYLWCVGIGVVRDDPDEGDVHHPCRLRADRAARGVGVA